jgi:hypothetical protein
MKHAVWIALLVAACGREGTSGAPEALTATTSQPIGVVLSRDTQALQVVRGPKGAKVDLQGGFQSAAIVRRAADGSLQADCFDQDGDAQSFMQADPATVKRTPEVQ